MERKRAACSAGVLCGICSVHFFLYQSVFFGSCRVCYLLKFIFVVDSVTTLHGVQTDTVAVSPTVLIKCCICISPYSLMHTPIEWLNETVHDR